MKKIFFSSLILLGAGNSFAQTLSPEVISSAGTSMTDGTTTLEWTMGESVTATLDNTQNMLSQGFHQTYILVTSISNTVVSGLSVFPNPTINVVNVQFSSDQKNTVVELYSVEGKLLEKHAVNSRSLELDLSAYPAGSYFLRVNNSDTHKLLKSH
ncbi:MAG: T9SS type A sorting domain-containing protein [Bacteroidetes bacterium]|nr:T9SS type A sorting domain-containing protein [Bacteroidota bacterium]